MAFPLSLLSTCMVRVKTWKQVQDFTFVYVMNPVRIHRSPRRREEKPRVAGKKKASAPSRRIDHNDGSEKGGIPSEPQPAGPRPIPKRRPRKRNR